MGDTRDMAARRDGRSRETPLRDGATRTPVRLAVVCAVVLACETYQTWLLNNGIFPVTSEVFPLAREFQTAVGVFVGLFVLLAAMRRPCLLRPVPLLVGSLAATALAAGLLVLAPHTPLLVTVGLMLRSLGGAATFYLLGVAYALVGPTRGTAVSVSCGLLVATLVTVVLPAPGFVASVLLSVALTAGCIAMLWRVDVPLIGRIAATEGTELRALASPRSFLSPFHPVYVLLALFSLASGFALSLRIVLYTPVASSLQIIVLGLAVVCFVLSRAGRSHEDALFALAALLVVAGFLAAPLGSSGAGGAANGLLYAGNACFRILSWTALAALGARNLEGALLVLACAGMATSAGTFAGADLGHLCNALLMADPQAAVLVCGAAVLGLFAYVLLGLRGFSFAETIRGIAPAPEAPRGPQNTPEPSSDELLDAACDALAAEKGLTEREREVLGMLARGHNGYHIRDELTLSYNTVKTHVKRIYRKLDVHSQQELIDLADARTRDESA